MNESTLGWIVLGVFVVIIGFIDQGLELKRLLSRKAAS